MVSGMKQSFVAVQSTFTLIFSAAPNVVPRIRATLTLLIAWSGNVPFVCGHLLRHVIGHSSSDVGRCKVQGSEQENKARTEHYFEMSFSPEDVSGPAK